jgi:phosphoribosylglycinamide formyltransferase-1
MRIGILGSGSGKPLEKWGNIGVVVANKDCRLRATAKKLGVPFTRAASEAEAIEALKAREVDTVVLRAYNRILGKEFIAAFGGRVISTHPSLLPDFAGTTYEQTLKDVLDAAPERSGCTVHVVDEGVDTGRVLAQESFRIMPKETLDSLREKAETLEAVLVPEALARL